MMKKTHADSFCLLIGPPRSGTTLISNAFFSHPKVSGVIEPFQKRRHSSEGKTEISIFIEENGTDTSDLSMRPNLAVKETTTRIANADLSFQLMKNFADADIYTCLIIILRCPFASFLSQVEASSKLWKEKKLTEASSENFSKWVLGQQQALKFITDRARAQHFRLVSYEAFCKNSRVELARLMALVPLHLDDKQFEFAPPHGVQRGGDPKTLEKSGRIEVMDRSNLISDFMDRVRAAPGFKLAHSLKSCVDDSICIEPDNVALDRLSRIVTLGG
jgi:hypothetical protein